MHILKQSTRSVSGTIFFADLWLWWLKQGKFLQVQLVRVEEVVCRWTFALKIKLVAMLMCVWWLYFLKQFSPKLIDKTVVSPQVHRMVTFKWQKKMYCYLFVPYLLIFKLLSWIHCKSFCIYRQDCTVCVEATSSRSYLYRHRNCHVNEAYMSTCLLHCSTGMQTRSLWTYLSL